VSLLVLAAVLASCAELVHAIMASIAIGGIYPAAVARFALITALAIFVALSRKPWARWILIAFAAWWAVDYGAQASATRSLGLALLAIALAASAILLIVAGRAIAVLPCALVAVLALGARADEPLRVGVVVPHEGAFALGVDGPELGTGISRPDASRPASHDRSLNRNR
jgi:hypothetical protein